MPKIALINGPNLNMLGIRQPELYGATTLAELEEQFCTEAKALGYAVSCIQSNHEGVLVDFIQQIRNECAALVINPAAYSHTSIAILDALNMFDGLVVEVHISDIYTREEFRHFSYVSQRADKVIAGRGIQGYVLALQHLDAHLKNA